MPRVDVVIVNWNGLRYLPECLEALSQQVFQDFQVWFVDNGSSDGSVNWVREHYPHIRVIANNVNRGFAAANNQAIRCGSAPFVATLNNDAVPAPNWLAEMVKAMESYPTVGMVASLMLFYNAPAIINSAGIAVDRLGFAWDRLGGLPIHSSEREPISVFGACAGAALYRRAMLDQIGLFDEDFFAYLEDVDLAWRAQWAGWDCLYVPTARVLHHHSATAREGLSLKDYLLARNKVWLVAKNYPRRALVAYLPLIALYDAMAALSMISRRRTLCALRGRAAGWRNLSGALKQHSTLIRKRAEDEVMSMLSPVDSPFRVRARYEHLQ
ncbi:MAG: glycosyltransferase family 2 protein [Thermoflexales bacterium]|nr:glycosyltransferase family 2 protein [Thermoflexales bacterium]